MRMLLHLSLLALGAAYVSVTAAESTMNGLVAETLTLLSAHRTLLIGDGVIFFLIPTHQLCIEEVFQGIDILKNRTAQEEAVDKLFRNLSLIKQHIEHQKKKCAGERWRVKKFLDYLQVFLGVINTEWTTES
uniref:Interleukin-5 n=1 Tax=Ursus americanus TaxID=9643 RepID=A0A452RKH5_URSAM